MSDQGARDYRDYVSDPELARVYGDYQKKYAENPRESDKKTAHLVQESVREMGMAGRAPRILDIGCSTGNFLRHLRRVMPGAELVGGDLMTPVVEQCRRDPALQGIQFDEMDVLDIPSGQPFDVITANAITYLFEPETYRKCCLSLGKALRPGGYFIGYELTCPGTEQRRITEPSAWHPNGLTLWLRSEMSVADTLRDAGFSHVTVEPFDIPIDLPRPAPGSKAEASFETYTIREAGTGRRLMFRGTLYQPWAHIRARKES